MSRRAGVIAIAIVSGLIGVVALASATGWWLWRQSVDSEAAYSGGLASRLGTRTADIITGIRDMLADFDQLKEKPCSADHLRVLKAATVSRPYVRGVGFWRADQRLCGIGFLPDSGIRPPRADRIYPNGVIAWWPSAHTQVGGIRMFLMRYGNYDVAIDPALLLQADLPHDREAALWVEGLQLAALPRDAHLPAPGALPGGVTLDRERGVVLSHFSEHSVLPIDVVAQEPMTRFWTRHAPLLLLGAALGLLLMVAWVDIVMRLSHRELDPVTALRRALRRERLDVHYQPVIALGSGRCIGAEALARWRRDDGTWTSPALFIPLAEQSGLIREITLFVIKRVVRDLRTLRAEAGSPCININLSRDDLVDDRTAQALAQSLAAAQLPNSAIKLEITERSLVNSETARIVIRDLRSQGHAIAIDDFGTGYSSLAYLQSFELDLLKIDKSFVDAIDTGAATSQVIVHVIEMAKSLNLQLVAEGVESRAQAEWLAAHGVDFVQGFFYSRPLALDAYMRFQQEHGHA